MNKKGEYIDPHYFLRWLSLCFNFLMHYIDAMKLLPSCPEIIYVDYSGSNFLLGITITTQISIETTPTCGHNLIANLAEYLSHFYFEMFASLEKLQPVWLSLTWGVPLSYLYMLFLNPKRTPKWIEEIYFRIRNTETLAISALSMQIFRVHSQLSQRTLIF